MAQPPETSAALVFAARTDPGRRRDHNEDQVATDPGRGLALLADGMGGHKGGEVASRLAIEVALNEAAARIDQEVGGASDDDAEEGAYRGASRLAREIVAHANTIVHDTARTQPQYEGMGTTLVLALFRDGYLSIAHVGDSRVYRLREGHLEQLTRDHTLVQDLVDQGVYSADQARDSHNRHVVTQALGAAPTVAVDLQEDIALPGDIYLLCSDGLNDMVGDETVRLTLDEFADNLDRAAQRLIDQANECGGHDNISVVLVKVLEPFHSGAAWFRRVVDWFQ